VDDSCGSARRKQRGRNVSDGRNRIALDSRERFRLLRGVQRRRCADVITERGTEQRTDTDSDRQYTDSGFEPDSDSERHIVSADRRTNVDVNGRTDSDTGRHWYTDSNADAEPDTNTHSDPDPDSDDNVDAATDADADRNANGNRDADAESVDFTDACSDSDTGHTDAFTDAVPIDKRDADTDTRHRRQDRSVVLVRDVPERERGHGTLESDFELQSV
jgi:hypothetical protein